MRGYGLCRNCYQRYWYHNRPLGICQTCQQEKPIYADGQCNNCYQNKKIGLLPEKACTQCGQKDKKIRLGLCRKCYKQHWNDQNMQHIIEYNDQWDADHPERRKATEQRYDSSPRGRVINQINRQLRLARIKQAPGDGLPIEEWERILEEHHHRCYYCGASGKMTIEHMVPLSRGGAHDSSNIVPACEHCNKSKNTKTAEEFIAKLKGEGK